MALAVPDATELLGSSEIENKFKMAQVLHIQNDFPRAMNTYRSVCLAVERVVRANPGANVELHHVPLSLEKLSQIYQKKEDQHKALAFIQCEKKFFEYIAANRPNHEDEDSADGGHEFPDHNLDDLFDEMHRVFDSPDAPPPQDPKEIAQRVMEAKKKYDEEQAAINLKKLQEIMAARKAKLETSRWEQTLDYIDKHPIKVTLAVVIFMAIFLLLTIGSFDIRQFDPSKGVKDLRAEAARKANRNGHGGGDTPGTDKKMTAEDMKKIKEMIDDLRKQEL
jgi:hypothetical protein